MLTRQSAIMVGETGICIQHGAGKAVNFVNGCPYGAGHGSEVSFVFNTLNARWGNPGEATPQEKELAMVMNTYWTNFAKTGNPNGNGLTNWPLYNTQTEEILDIDLDGKTTSKPDPRKARFNVVEKAFKQRTRLQARGI